MWLYLALLGYSCLAVVSILDKFILSREKLSPTVFVFYSTVFLFPLALFVPWLSPRPSPFSWTLIAIGASAFALSLWTMYLAFQKSEVSHVGPLIGAVIPLFILVLSRFFLGEQIFPAQIFGVLLLSLGSLIIAAGKNRPHHDASASIRLGIISAGLFSIFHVTAKSIYTEFGFSHGVFYLWGAVGVIGLLLFLKKNVRRALFPERKFLQMFNFNFFHKSSSKLQIITVVADKTLSAVGVFLVQYSIAIGSVTRVNALGGYQFGLLIVLVAVLSKFWPRVFSEHYEKGEFRRELLAVSIIALGLYYLVR